MNLLRKFYNATEGGSGYGYEDDSAKAGSPFVFGLNTTEVFLKKFSWIPNGGKDGAEQEALDIVFSINGTEKSYRKFPVTHGFDKNNQKVTDPAAPEFKQALSDFNAVMVHILSAYVNRETIKAAFSRKIANFKEYCDIAKSLLPGPTTPTIPLHIFMHYGWKLGDNAKQTYLEIPTKMTGGYWLIKAADAPGNWVEKRAEVITDSTKEALWYENGLKDDKSNPIKHPFQRDGYFMLRNHAIQQKGDNTMNSVGASAMNTGTAPAASNGAAAAPAATQPAAAGW